jgi:hypothetical protein
MKWKFVGKITGICYDEINEINGKVKLYKNPSNQRECYNCGVWISYTFMTSLKKDFNFPKKCRQQQQFLIIINHQKDANWCETFHRDKHNESGGSTWNERRKWLENWKKEDEKLIF